MKIDNSTEQPLWAPDQKQVAASQLFAFARQMEKATGRSFPDYDSLWQWSVEQPGAFWDAVWDFTGVVGEKGSVQLAHADQMPGAQFFPQARINFAENLLRRRDHHPGIIFRDEKENERTLTFNDLYDQVSRLAQGLKAAGVTVGDRVAGFMPNMPETMIAMLATASLGAIWSSASPD